MAMKQPCSKDASTYGRIQSQKNPAAYRIWCTRHEEPPLCEPFGMWCDYVTDQAREDDIAHGAALWSTVDMKCNHKEKSVLTLRLKIGLSLEEVASVMWLTRERIRQIEKAAYRRIRKEHGVEVAHG